MVIYYKNEHGTIRINGGGTDRAWRMTEITGIGFPKKSFTYNTYAGVFGQELKTVSIPSRIITISGDISYDALKSLSMSQAIRILNTDGELSINTRGKIRRAKVRTLSFETPERKNAFKTFVLQIESDNPYFFGREPLAYAVYSQQKLLKSTFTLPCMFSKRNMSATVINGGDVECEPVITISKPAESAVVENDSVVIKNADFSDAITLNHTMAPGETVTVDIPNRTIMSSIFGSIISAISDDTVLSSFILRPGANEISCESGDISLSVSCAFEELYLEASHDE